MKKMQIQGVHPITLVGSTKKSAVDFWQGVLGMPFIFEQPNLGNPEENHLYFDPGDGRLLTVFTNETREDAARPAPREVGCIDHIDFNVSRATFTEAPARLTAHGISFYERDRGFMNSIYLKDPNGMTVELACYKFQTPDGFRDADLMIQAHRLRVERGSSYHRRTPRRCDRDADADARSAPRSMRLRGTFVREFLARHQLIDG